MAYPFVYHALLLFLPSLLRRALFGTKNLSSVSSTGVTFIIALYGFLVLVHLKSNFGIHFTLFHCCLIMFLKSSRAFQLYWYNYKQAFKYLWVRLEEVVAIILCFLRKFCSFRSFVPRCSLMYFIVHDKIHSLSLIRAETLYIYLQMVVSIID